MVHSITRYRRANRRSPTWAEALSGVDPALCEPITTVPEGWPLAPAVWRRELRQRLMGELETRPLGHLHPDTAVPAARRRRPRLAQHREPATRRAAPAGHHPVAGTRAAGPPRHLVAGTSAGCHPVLAPGRPRPPPPDRARAGSERGLVVTAGAGPRVAAAVFTTAGRGGRGGGLPGAGDPGGGVAEGRPDLLDVDFDDGALLPLAVS
jgi:hypothetical protein